MSFESATSIARLLASCKASVRERAVRHLLSSYLPTTAAAGADLLKIWKGLFFCYWHADKPAYQAGLAARLAGAVSSSPDGAAFFDAALTTLRREWPGIDAHRLDKFYLLARRLLRHGFLLLRHSDAALTSRVIAAITATLGSASSPGLAYHLAEAFLDEIEEALPLSSETLETVLSPFFSVLEKSTNKVLVGKVNANVFEKLLKHGAMLASLQKAGEEVDPDSPVTKFGKIGFLMGFSKRFFKAAAAPETVQASRKLLFALHEGFLKLEKDWERSGVEITAEDFSDRVGNGVELDKSESCRKDSELVNGVRLSSKKLSKKRKMAKKANGLVEPKKSEGGITGEEKPDLDKLIISWKDKAEKIVSKKRAKKKMKSSNALDEQGSSSSATFSVGSGSAPEIEAVETGDSIVFSDTMLSNLQRKLEEVAAEDGVVDRKATVDRKEKTKRKRAKSANQVEVLDLGYGEESAGSGGGGSSSSKNGNHAGKKVRFAMKNNLVWRPHTPLPPQSLRLPPSTTPRGSALKKGVPPGPVKETPPPAMVKKAKMKVKKGRKKGSKKLHMIPSLA